MLHHVLELERRALLHQRRPRLHAVQVPEPEHLGISARVPVRRAVEQLVVQDAHAAHVAERQHLPRFLEANQHAYRAQAPGLGLFAQHPGKQGLEHLARRGARRARK